jgi:hypothetical protein
MNLGAMERKHEDTTISTQIKLSFWNKDLPDKKYNSMILSASTATDLLATLEEIEKDTAPLQIVAVTTVMRHLKEAADFGTLIGLLRSNP